MRGLAGALAVVTLASCASVRYTPHPDAYVLQGSPQLFLELDGTPSYQHVLRLTIAGHPRHYPDSIYLLVLQEGDYASVHMVFSPNTQRVFAFSVNPRLATVPPEVVIAGGIFQVLGFDIYGNPRPGKEIVSRSITVDNQHVARLE